MEKLFINIKSLVGVLDPNVVQKKGAELQELTQIEQAFLKVKDGQIADFGKMSSLTDHPTDAVDLQNKIVLPCFCDSHTHLVFATTRENEFVDRIKGLSYEEIAQNGGGILNSAKKLQAASEDELFKGAKQRLNEVIHMGTGAIEIKSGYGLSTQAELKMLRVIQRLKQISPIDIKATFLGAHAFPMAYKNNQEGYMKLLTDEMLPLVAKENLADYIDVFCDRGFFSQNQTERLLEAGYKYGLKPKIHANELDYSGGIQVGTKHKAISVDHLECTGEGEIAALQSSHTIATLLPSTAFFLKLHYPPARKMIQAGLPIALASDYNPGSSPSGNMHFICSLACLYLNMLPEETINAATINGAAALELAHSHGSITKGKKANFWVSESINSVKNIPYGFGRPQLSAVYINGERFTGF